MSTQLVDSRISILIIDDDSGIRLNLQERLTKAGYRADSAANGMHAFTKIRSGFKPDLILCDLIMPGMNGSEFLLKLRADPDCKDVPLILLTGSTDRTQIMETARQGISHLFFKPLNYSEVVKKVHLFLMKEKAQDEAA